MVLTANDIRPKNVNGKIVELSDEEKQVILDKWNAPDTTPYDQKRRAEYPSIEECVHAILDDQLDALQVKRQAVKAKYPKP